MAERFKVEVGDIYRDKDPRIINRFVKAKSVDIRHAYVIGCTAEGKEVGRRTRISLAGLESRFERVGGSTVKADLEAAALKALRRWADAVKELKAASAALKSSTANTYPELWEREHAAVKTEAANREALLEAADSLTPLAAEEDVKHG